MDLGNCFRICKNDDKSFCYFNPTEQTTVSNSNSVGGNIGLGTVAGVIGIGGVVGVLANGVSVGESSNTSTHTTYSQQRFIAIPPHSIKPLTENNWVKTKKGTLLNSGKEYINVGHSESFDIGIDGNLRNCRELKKDVAYLQL